MGTRALIKFRTDNYTAATIYRHFDGYPEGVGKTLAEFFAAIDAQCEAVDEHRFNDPSYLAAKFVVFQATKYARDPSRPLNFLSVGIVPNDSEPEAYNYEIVCDPESMRSRTKPKVLCDGEPFTLPDV